MKTVWQFLKRLNTELPSDSAVPFLGIQEREMETYVPRKVCTQMFIAALL